MLSPFHVLHPTTVPEAASELHRLGDRVKVYAGGAELLLLLRHKFLEAEYLLNIKGIRELDRIVRDGPLLQIGATVTHHRLESDALVRECLPMFAHAESQVANIRVRNQGTLGGNLCFNDPHSDPSTSLLVYEAKVVVAGRSGARQMPLGDFLVGMYATALEPDELLAEVQVPPLPSGFGNAYLRVHNFQRPTLGVAVAARLEDERIAGVRLAVGCIGPKAERLRELEAQLMGASLIEAGKIISESKRYLTDLFQPVNDLLGSADYKLYITQVLLQRGLEQAVQGNGGHESVG
jgi:aerobic carbon-monoxide dehydrogenase medium subunit